MAPTSDGPATMTPAEWAAVIARREAETITLGPMDVARLVGAECPRCHERDRVITELRTRLHYLGAEGF